jgi:hypothetical protein
VAPRRTSRSRVQNPWDSHGISQTSQLGPRDFGQAVADLASAASITIDPALDQAAISPYIYGVNQADGSTVPFTAQRLGEKATVPRGRHA